MSIIIAYFAYATKIFLLAIPCRRLWRVARPCVVVCKDVREVTVEQCVMQWAANFEVWLYTDEEALIFGGDGLHNVIGGVGFHVEKRRQRL
jgi:hypothetical protein